MTIETKLKEIRDRVEKAARSPWYIEDCDIRYYFSNTSDESGEVCCVGRISEELDHRKPNREFIAHARQDVPLLLEALDLAIDSLDPRSADETLKEIEKLFEGKK